MVLPQFPLLQSDATTVWSAALSEPHHMLCGYRSLVYASTRAPGDTQNTCPLAAAALTGPASCISHVCAAGSKNEEEVTWVACVLCCLSCCAMLGHTWSLAHRLTGHQLLADSCHGDTGVTRVGEKGWKSCYRGLCAPGQFPPKHQGWGE